MTPEEQSEFCKLVIDGIADCREVLPWLGMFLSGQGGNSFNPDGSLVFTEEKALAHLRRIEDNLTRIRNAVPAEKDYVHKQIAEFLEKK